MHKMALKHHKDRPFYYHVGLVTVTLPLKSLCFMKSGIIINLGIWSLITEEASISYVWLRLPGICDWWSRCRCLACETFCWARLWAVCCSVFLQELWPIQWVHRTRIGYSEGGREYRLPFKTITLHGVSKNKVGVLIPSYRSSIWS